MVFHTKLSGKIVKIVLDYLEKKSIKCPVLLAQFEGKSIFLVFHSKLSGKIVKIVLDYLAKKSIKCPVLLAQFEGKYRPI